MGAVSDSGVWAPAQNCGVAFCVVLQSADSRGSSSSGVVEFMLRTALGPLGKQACVYEDETLAVGIINPSLQTRVQAVSLHHSATTGTCMIEGDIYTPPDGLDPDRTGADLASWVAERLAHGDVTCLNDVRGMFSGFYISPQRDGVRVFVDPAGLRAAFYYVGADCVVATNNLWAFRGCTRFEKKWEPRSVLEHLTIGPIMDERTWIRGVHMVPMSSIYTLSPNRKVEKRCYRRPEARRDQSLAVSARCIRDALDRITTDIAGRLEGRVALALSGGLDSRLLLASLHSAGIECPLLTVASTEQALELVVARAAGRRIGRDVTLVVSDVPRAASVAPDAAIMTEGQNLNHGMFFAGQAARESADGLFIGYAGDILAGAHQGAYNAHAIRTREGLARAILRSWATLFPPHEAEALVPGFAGCTFADVVDAVNQNMDQVEGDSIPDVCREFLMRYRMGRRTRGRLDAARCYCTPLYPFVDERLMSVFRTLPRAHLETERAHIAALGTYGLGLDDVPISARWKLGIPIREEYARRRRIRLLRYLSHRVTQPLRETVQDVGSRVARSHRPLDAEFEKAFALLASSAIVDQDALRRVRVELEIGRPRRRVLVRVLVCLRYVEHFLFGNETDETPAFAILSAHRPIEVTRRPLVAEGMPDRHDSDARSSLDR